MTLTDENVIKSVGVEGGISVAEWIEQIFLNGKDWKVAYRTAGVYGFDRISVDREGEKTTYLLFSKDGSKLYFEGDMESPTKVWR